MVLFNYQRREITGKLVYYGPGLCGKTSNLQYIHDNVDPSDRGKMVSLSTDADRTLFFDFMPIDAGYIKGMKIKFQLYTVPGQVHYNETRKMVLRGADAVVFVADSQESLLDSNVFSYENMVENLKENGLDPDRIPMVIQYNKRDLPDILTLDALNEKLNTRGVKWFEAIAIKGPGVMETFQEIGRLLLVDIGNKYKVEVTAEREKADEDKGRKPSKKSDPLKDETKVKEDQPHGSPDSPTTKTDDYAFMHYAMANEFVVDFNEDGQLDLTRQIPDESEVVFHTLKPTTSASDDANSKHTKPDGKTGPKATKTATGDLSVKHLENQMDLKIIMQRLKKVMEDNYDILERQTQITRTMDEIKEELRKLQK
ncbi:GTPase domain-containing protein [bacterium]|nr:GTPase domain-containing protein [bacterium]